MAEQTFASVVTRTILIAALEWACASRLVAAVQQDSATVELRSRRAVLSPETTDSFFRALRSTTGEALHGLAFLRSHPDDSVRRALHERGFEIRSRVQGRIYLARFGRRLDRNDDLVRAYVGAAAVIEPRDKVAPDIWEGRYERFVVRLPAGETNPILNRDSTLSLMVAFHIATPAGAVAAVLRRHTRHSAQIGDTHWRVEVSGAGLRRLAAEDIVLAIGPVPPPLSPERSAIRIDSLPARVWLAVPPVNGAGVQVGVFDSGFDEEHDDFRAVVLGTLGGSRVILPNPLRKPHGTLVAGVIAGSGWRSDKKDSQGHDNNGTPYQWRGLAPGAELIDAAIFKQGHIDFRSTDVLAYILNQGMDLSNHSYDVGYYVPTEPERILTALHDRIVVGEEKVGGVAVPPRIEVWSAGNKRVGLGYFSLNNEMKNGLVVGNWYEAENRTGWTSSAGPTWDGRIKPDVVAPGTDIITTGYWGDTSEDPGCELREVGTPPLQQFYCKATGTSVAAPGVTCMLALILQQYATTYGVSLDDSPPLPSTLRALAIHSAHDRWSEDAWFTSPDPTMQAFPGPDFLTGWGLVNAEGAVELVRNRLVLVGRIKAACEAARYPFSVTDGSTEPVKVTLAWDDLPDDLLSAATVPRLKNDLDLVLVDPAGVRHYPWQLDQQITDAAGNLLKPEEQTCQSAIRVKRWFDPLAGQVPASAVIPAARGPDHLNNVEQVGAPRMSGTWYAEVSGFDIVSPQPFSLIGVPFRLFRPDWTAFCERHHCESWLPDLCRRYPVICRPIRELPIGPVGLTVTFRDAADRLILPVPELCAQLGAPDACYRPGASYDIEIGPSSSGVGVELYTGRGRHAAGRVTARSAYRLTLDPGNVESLLVLAPSRTTGIGHPYELRLRIRPR